MPSAQMKSHRQISVLLAVRRWVEAHAGWAVVLCSAETLLTLRHLMVGVMPTKSKFSGRTALLPNGGKISIVQSQTVPFLPLDQEFALYTVGKKLPGREVWDSRAPQQLNLELHV